MLKKILFGVFAVLAGLLVYIFSSVLIIGGYQKDQFKKAAEEENYEFFLKFTGYYNPTPIFESVEGDPLKLKIFEVYQEGSEEAPSDVGYFFIMFDLDEKVAINTKEDKSKIVFNASYLNEEAEYVPFEAKEIPLNLSSYSYYGTVFPFAAFGLDQGFNYIFGEFKDDELVKKADVKKVTKIELKDSEGEIFYTIEQDLMVGDIKAEDIINNGKPGFTDKEIRSFNNPKSCVWKQGLIMAGYVLIVGGLGILLFKKPREAAHASANEFLGNMENPYDVVVNEAKKERVTLKQGEDAKEEPTPDSKEE